MESQKTDVVAIDEQHSGVKHESDHDVITVLDSSFSVVLVGGSVIFILSIIPIAVMLAELLFSGPMDWSDIGLLLAFLSLLFLYWFIFKFFIPATIDSAKGKVLSIDKNRCTVSKGRKKIFACETEEIEFVGTSLLARGVMGTAVLSFRCRNGSSVDVDSNDFSIGKLIVFSRQLKGFLDLNGIELQDEIGLFRKDNHADIVLDAAAAFHEEHLGEKDNETKRNSILPSTRVDPGKLKWTIRERVEKYRVVAGFALLLFFLAFSIINRSVMLAVALLLLLLYMAPGIVRMFDLSMIRIFDTAIDINITHDGPPTIDCPTLVSGSLPGYRYRPFRKRFERKIIPFNDIVKLVPVFNYSDWGFRILTRDGGFGEYTIRHGMSGDTVFWKDPNIMVQIRLFFAYVVHEFPEVWNRIFADESIVVSLYNFNMESRLNLRKQWIRNFIDTAESESEENDLVEYGA